MSPIAAGIAAAAVEAEAAVSVDVVVAHPVVAAAAGPTLQQEKSQWLQMHCHRLLALQQLYAPSAAGFAVAVGAAAVQVRGWAAGAIAAAGEKIAVAVVVRGLVAVAAVVGEGAAAAVAGRALVAVAATVEVAGLAAVEVAVPTLTHWRGQHLQNCFP